MSLWASPRSDADADADAVARVAINAARATDPAGLRDALAGAIADGSLDVMCLDMVSTDVIVVKKRRWVIAATVGEPWRPRRVVVKGYAGAVAAAVHRNHQALWSATWPKGVAVTRPLGVVPDLGATVTEFASGAHAHMEDPGAPAAVGRAAAALHRCGASLTPRVAVDDVLANAVRHARLVGTAQPGLGELAETAVDAARACSAIVRDPPTTAVHGDLSCDAFLVGEPVVHLIDWDMACRFDPAWDVGHFVAQLARLGLDRQRDTADAAAEFVAAYLAAGDADPHLPGRARFYESLTYVHKAYTVLRQHGNDALGTAARLLEWASKGFGAL